MDDTDADMDADDANDTCQTKNNCIGLLPNEPKKGPKDLCSLALKKLFRGR